MAFHRKAAPILDLNPDIAIISECAAPEVLESRGLTPPGALIWTGDNPNKGLAVFAFGKTYLSCLPAHDPRLRHILPIRVTGPLPFHLLAVWAQNASGGNTRKHQLGPLRRAVARYRDFIAKAPTLLAGDLNNNVFWDRPGWRINHAAMVENLARHGLTSAYHDITGEAQGAETQPTLYWRDRTRDGPTYHIDYVFRPGAWAGAGETLTIGGYDDWVGNGLSDHVPLIWDMPLPAPPLSRETPGQ